jgi:hypothetical protein
MLEHLMLLAVTLSSPRLDVEVQNKECVIREIRYNYIHSYIHAVGNCDFIYEKCIEDKCDVEKLEYEDLNFGKKNVG